jgi:hypothetical protein
MLELFKTSYFKQPEPTPALEPEPEQEPTSESVVDGEGATEVKKPKKKGPKKQFFPPAFSECSVVFIDESELPGFGVSTYQLYFIPLVKLKRLVRIALVA